MQARETMSRDVVSVRADTPVQEAVRMLVQHRISGLPVVDAQDRLVGIITEHDLMLRHWSVRLVEDVMTRQVITARESTPIAEISALLMHHSIKRVVIVHDERVVGIVSRVDVIRAQFAEETDAEDAPEKPQR